MRTFKKMNRMLFLIVVGVLCHSIVKAQYDAMFTQYMFNEMFINPAYAGSKEALSVTALHRQQWSGFPGRPVTTTFSMHGPLAKNKMGLGLSILNEKIGVLNRNLIYASYAYRMKTGKTGYLSFGAMGGAHIQATRFGDLKNITNTADVQFSQNSPTVVSPNFGAGVYYYSNKFYAGFSVPRLVNDNVEFAADGSVKRGIKFNSSNIHSYMTVGGIVNVADGLVMKPQLMVKIVKNAPIEFDPNLNFLIWEKLWLGASYRSFSDISAIVGFQANAQFLASISYDYSLTRIQKYTTGSFEVALSYTFGFKGKKIATPRYF